MYEPLKIAVDLLINSTKLVQTWITRFIVVNGALFSAVGVILTWETAPQFKNIAPWALMAICVLGGLASSLMLGVILRQNRWQFQYVQNVIAIQEQLHLRIQPSHDEVPGGAFVTTFVYVMAVGITGAWIWLGALIYQHLPFR
jgi:hypothetical protein